MSSRPESRAEVSAEREKQIPLLERVRALAPLVEREAEDAERKGTLGKGVVAAAVLVLVDLIVRRVHLGGHRFQLRRHSDGESLVRLRSRP